jgi:hypothetical protein
MEWNRNQPALSPVRPMRWWVDGSEHGLVLAQELLFVACIICAVQHDRYLRGDAEVPAN